MKVIVNVDSAGYQVLKDGTVTGNLLLLDSTEEYKENTGDNIVQLVSLGVTPDELVKMKASGII